MASVGVALNEGNLVYAASFFSSSKQSYFIGGYLRFRIIDCVGSLPYQDIGSSFAVQPGCQVQKTAPETGWFSTGGQLRVFEVARRKMPFTAVTCCQISK